MKLPAWLKIRISTGTDPLPDQQALVALSLGYVLVVSTHIVHLPWWLSAIVVILFLWRIWIMRRALAIPGRLIRYTLLAIIVLLVYRHYDTLLGRDAGVALLVVLTALKFLEIRDFRDCMIVVFLCLLIGMSSFLYSQDLLLGGYLFAVVIMLTAVMQYLNHSERRRLPVMIRQSAKLVMLALPVGLLLFILFPRVPLGLFGLPNDSHAGMTGMSDVIEPGYINQLNESDEVAFRVEFEGKPPAMKKRYWRGLVLGEYKDNRWRRYKSYLQILNPGFPRYDDSSVLFYNILLEPSSKRWVFALDLPVVKPQTLYWGTGQTVRARERLLERARFRLGSSLAARMTSLEQAEHDRYVQVPPDVRQSLAELADKLYAEAGRDPAAYIDRVLGYFREEGFIYTLTPPRLGDEPMRQFLLETRSGYCEHYASAFALLMRMVGIPARLVAGYQGGEWNPQGKYMIVRQSDAHAWAEVWLHGRGWVRVDPTAVVAPERIDYGLDALRLLVAQGKEPGTVGSEQLRTVLARPLLLKMWDRTVWFWDDLNTSWYLWVIGYDQDRQQGLLKRLGLSTLGWRGMLIIAALLAGMLALIQAVVLVRKRWLRDNVVQNYERFCQRLAAIGLLRRPFEGPIDFARRVMSEQPQIASPVTRITDLYVSIHYGDNHDVNAIRRLSDLVKAFRPEKMKLRSEKSV